MDLSGEPIIILGTFRGGTSCLSTVLVALGMYMGEPKAFQAANEFNKGGYWELEDMQALNARGLVMYGMSYLGTDHMADDWRDLPGTARMSVEVKSMLHKHFEGHEHWGWKEPATTNLFPLYKDALQAESVQPRYAISVRHPLSVAASRKRQFLIKNAGSVQDKLPPDEQRAVGLWVDYMLSNLRETKGAVRHMLSYEDLVEDPRPHIERLARDLLPWKPTEEQIQAAVDTINPEWSHSRFAKEDLDGWPTIVARTYELCLRAAADSEGLNAGKFDAEVDALWDEWQTVSNMVRATQLPAGHLILSWREGGALKHTDQSYTPTGGWQTLRANVTAGPGESVQITPYQLGCQIWIKRAIWRVNGAESAVPLKPGPGGILEDFGTLRLTAFGSGAMLTQAPAAGPAEFEIEFLLQFNVSALTTAVSMLRDRLEHARRSGQPR